MRKLKCEFYLTHLKGKKLDRRGILAKKVKALAIKVSKTIKLWLHLSAGGEPTEMAFEKK